MKIQVNSPQPKRVEPRQCLSGEFYLRGNETYLCVTKNHGPEVGFVQLSDKPKHFPLGDMGQADMTWLPAFSVELSGN